MPVLSETFIRKVARCLQDEEIDIYVLALYSMNREDLNYFGEEDRARVKAIFKILKEDTQCHSELLKLIVELGSH